MPELPEITDFLYLHDNRIASISFARLGHLKYLNLGDNSLAPQSLEELRLESSGLTALPDAIGSLGRLTELALRGNGLATLPASMRSRGSTRSVRAAAACCSNQGRNKSAMASAVLYGAGSSRLVNMMTVSRSSGKRTITLRKLVVSPECHSVRRPRCSLMRQPKP